MNTKENRYDIVGGPNKDILFDACKYACSKNVKIDIDFTVSAGYTIPKDHPGCAYIPMDITGFRIIGIEHEDGSEDSLNLHGYCKANLSFIKDESTTYRFKAYYNAKHRRGCITLIEL